MFFDTYTDSTFFRYSPEFYHFLVHTLIDPFPVFARIVFPYSHGFYLFLVLSRIVFPYSHEFYLFLVLARILPFSGTHTDFPVIRCSSGKYFSTRTDSTFSRYSPGFYHFQVLTLILPFFDTRPDSFSVHARNLPFPGARPDSTIFRYSH